MKVRYLILVFATILFAACNSKNKCCESKDSAECPQNQANISAAPKTEDMKKVINAQIFIKTEKLDEFLIKVKEVIEKSRAEEGNISYTLYQDPTDKSKLIFFEEWKNQAAIDFHFNTEHFKAFGAVLDDCSSAPAIITIYDVASQK